MKRAFTIIELIFVIVIMGVLSKFGIEFLSQAYNTFIYSKIDNELHSKSSLALQIIANRLQYKIPQSTIKRIDGGKPIFAAQSVNNPQEYNVLEWIGYDADGARGDSKALWSGIIDLNSSLTTSDKLFSTQTDTLKIDALIKELGGLGIEDAALFFNNATYDIDSFGWNGRDPLNNHKKAIHPIKNGSNNNEFISGFTTLNFSGLRIYNRYFLTWSAYAIVHKDEKLTLYYNYQPWKGESYNDGESSVLMDGVDTFMISPSPDSTLFHIMICTKSDLLKELSYSLCKEKVIF